MPNLEQYAVTEWLTALRPAAAAHEWPPPIRAIETEADNPERLQALGSILDQLARGELETLAAALKEPTLRDDLRAVMAQLGAARMMRLLHWLAEIDLPGCPTVISALAGGDDATGHALRAAIAAITRRALLRRIFAPDRIAALHAACETALEEGA
jgi:hypothetical protein